MKSKLILVAYLLLSISFSFAQKVSVQTPDSVFSLGPGINWVGNWSQEEFNASHLSNDDDSKLLVETCPNEPSDTLFISDFGFDIPEGSEILNVKVTVVKSGYGSNDDVKDKLFVFGMKNSDSFMGKDQSKSDFFSPMDSTYIYEGGGVEWGIDFTPEIINDPNFGIYLLVESFVFCRGVELDFFQIEVEYDNLMSMTSNLESDVTPVLYPNPCNDQLFIHYEGIDNLKIFDSNGNLFPTNISQKVINTEALATGHYTLHFVSSSETKIVPFIKTNSH